MTVPMQLVFSAAQIEARVSELAAQIEQDCQGKPIVLLVVLKGAILFAADLLRRLHGDVPIDFFMVSSYATEDQPSGATQVHLAPRTELAGRHAILVNDIVDTDLTTMTLLERFVNASGAASARLCALLDKSAARLVPITIDYTGFEAPNLWLVGYGMDSDGLGRNLPDIHAVPNPSHSG